ncbi:MAG: hypothetical protein O3C40_03900 [Planctomycetota bacterium]|nr:hypothetical protein [Planctomycetota bacterium]
MKYELTGMNYCPKCDPGGWRLASLKMLGSLIVVLLVVLFPGILAGLVAGLFGTANISIGTRILQGLAVEAFVLVVGLPILVLGKALSVERITNDTEVFRDRLSTLLIFVSATWLIVGLVAIFISVANNELIVEQISLTAQLGGSAAAIVGGLMLMGLLMGGAQASSG